MNLKLKRIARTPYSEALSIFDGDHPDENGEAVNIGKIELHYLEDQIIGTLLIWQEYATGFARTHASGSDETMDTLIDDILAEVSDPLGVASEYGIEIYFPSLTNHQFVSNYEGDEGGAGAPVGESEALQDDFADQLRSRG
ncbi:MAG: hypothetical protein IVW55_03885 [Chloroflexi bacterium]|nr:hypothetical protein [Chloroflexota bacterium]